MNVGESGILSEGQIVSLVDPEVAPGIAGTLTPVAHTVPADALAIRALDDARAVPKEPVMPAPDVISVDGVEVRVHRPSGAGAAAAAVLLWIHGGGMFMGSAANDDGPCRAWADATGMAVVAVDYRLAPEHPHPIPLEDCFAALEWLASGTDAGLDPARIAVLGASAGGGLATGLALLARDRGVNVIRHVLAIYPMLDDRGNTPSSGRLANAPCLERASQSGWLGGLPRR